MTAPQASPVTQGQAHTAGPWHWVEDPRSDEMAQLVGADADKLLIAAAPDLLAALKGLLAVYQAMGNPRGPKEILAEAAILKATGAAA